jgi:hypothetical protein
MPTGQPYNSLGQLLAAGAEIGAASILLGGGSPADVSLYLDKRFGPVETAKRDALIGVALLGMAGGESVEAGRVSGSVSDADIPIQEQLFGDDFEGRRYYWKGLFQLPGFDSWYDISGDAATIGELIDQLEGIPAEAIRRAGDSPTKIPSQEGTTPDEVGVRITFSERRF